MADQNVNTPAATEPAFDFAAWKAQQDSTEAATRTGTAPAPTPKAAEAAAPGKPSEAAATPAAKAAEAQQPPAHEDDEDVSLSRAQRRRVRQAERDRDQAIGRMQALEEMLKSGIGPKPAAPAAPALPAKAPERADFDTESQFSAAVAKWEAKEAVAAADQRRSAEQGEQAERADFERRTTEANRLYTEQLADYPDHEEAIESLKAVPFDVSKDGTMLVLISQSTERAGIADYWHKHPDSLKYIMGLEPDAQHAAFARLEGKVEALREGRQAAKADPKPPTPPAAKPTAASRDAAKAAPSESITPKSGEAVNGVPSMTLADGSINPAWKAQQNDLEGRRR